MSDENKVKNCYLGINGLKYGPISEHDIQAQFAQGKITGDTMFIRIGMKEWIPLSKSGVVVPVTTDSYLPPLPQETKPITKSKLGVMAVVAGVAIVFSIFFISNSNIKKPVNNNLIQNTNTEKPLDANKAEIANTQVPNPAPIDNLAVSQNSKMSALDKVVTDNYISIKIPSSWDYYTLDSGDGFAIECNNDNIAMYAFIIATENFDASTYDVNEFTFADGEKGYVIEDYGTLTFFSKRDNIMLVYKIENFTNSDWYNQNKTLIYEVAKTLSFNNLSLKSEIDSNQSYNMLDYFPITKKGVFKYIKFESGKSISSGYKIEFLGYELVEGKDLYVTRDNGFYDVFWNIDEGYIGYRGQRNYNTLIDPNTITFSDYATSYSGYPFGASIGFPVEIKLGLSSDNIEYEHISQFTTPNGKDYNDIIMFKKSYSFMYMEHYFAKGIGLIYYREAPIKSDGSGNAIRGSFEKGTYLNSYEIFE